MGGGYYCNSSSVIVNGIRYTEYFDCFWSGDFDGGGSGGDPHGGGDIYDGGGGGGGVLNTCRNLRATKPAGCENEVSIPSSAEYGYGTLGTSQYAGGSGLPKLIYWKNNGPTATGISAQINRLLELHTQQLANGFVSRIAADKKLTDGLQAICLEQNRLSPYPYSAGTDKCLTALNRLIQERDNSTWLSGFRQWINANSLNLSINTTRVSFDFSNLVSVLDPANSLAKKYEIVSKDTVCATWWQDARSAGCVQ